MLPDTELVQAAGLTMEEYRQVVDILGRHPNPLETYLFGVMWSEHCSYKSSKVHLKTLPTKGPRVMIGPGENAGVVDVGDGLAVVFKIESHNHPSFIEPYQGAATGVGGILRDIFTMGARPILLLDSLRFGDPALPKTRYLVRGVVSGIGGYGNCIGVPTAGGETFFHPAYNGNPLVNAFCLGFAERDKIFLGKASGPGNPVIVVGSRTGKDGIHGAVMASETFEEGAEERRPTVQVGDPFTEKLLLEACLEAMATGALVGIQDMGAAGLTCSTCEMASRAGTGIEIDLDLIPLREEQMTPVEIMLSESQERMLLVAEVGREKEIVDIFTRWDLEAVHVGEVTDSGNVTLKWKGEVVADVPAHPLADGAPILNRPLKKPVISAIRTEFPDFPPIEDWQEFTTRLVSHPNLARKAWIWEQYDHMVRTNTVILPGGDAALMRLPGTERGVAVSLDGNALACSLDPYLGTMMSVAEAARNVACVGAQPTAVTNCLNFGNPEDPEIMWAFAEAVRGMGEACRVLETPVTGGNVSFYNQTIDQAVLTTPVIGMVGLLSNIQNRVTHNFKSPGDGIFLVGSPTASLAASAAFFIITARNEGPLPPINWAIERSLHRLLIESADCGLLSSAHNVTDGGLLITLLESSFGEGGSPLGFDLEILSETSPAEILLGEGPSRVVVSLPSDKRVALEQLAADLKVPVRFIGTVRSEPIGKIKVSPNEWLRLDLAVLAMAWRQALGDLLTES